MAKALILFLIAAISAEQAFGAFNVRPIDDPVMDLPWFKGTRPSHQERIIGGNQAAIGQFPHQVGLFITIGNLEAFCGGVFINDQWVVTAAHCTDNATAFEIVLGAVNIINLDNGTVVFNVGIESVFVHEEWDRDNIRNDIALLKLPTAPQQTTRIKPIALPQGSDLSSSFEGSSVTTSGWGKVSDGATSIATYLRYVESKVYSIVLCNVSYIFTLSKPHHICMSGLGGKSTCNGDSGGPLTTKNTNGIDILIGITSFGFSLSCELGWPSAFTRITSYVPWINNKTSI